MKIKTFALIALFSPFQHTFAQDLIETYQLALQNDPVLKQSFYNRSSIGESKSQSIAQMLPTISVSGKSSRERLNNKKVTFQQAGVQNYWDSGFSVDFIQPVFHWDHWVELGQSDNRIAQAEAEYQAEFQNLMVKSTEAYFNILSAQDNVGFNLSEQKAIERQLEQAKQRFDVGLVAITDVYEAQAGFDQAKANLIEAENELDDTKEALREIIGENEAELLSLGQNIDFTPPSPNDIAEWSNVAKTNNFTIIAALNQAEVSRKEIRKQQSGHLPTLDIVAQYAVQDSNSTFGLRGDTQGFGLQVNIPIFEGGMVYSRSKQAQFDYLAAKENLLSTQRQVKRQLRNAFRDVISSLSRVQALKASVDSAESALEATEAGFEVGTRTMVDVLSEQRNLFRAKADHSRSRYDYLVNGIKLKQAVSNLTEDDLQTINSYLQHQETHTEYLRQLK